MSSSLKVVVGAVLVGIAIASPAASSEGKISLADATQQAVASNLDLVARRRALAAAREEIALARSTLLPQVGVGARGQLLDDDRSDSERGNNVSESFLVAAGLSQVIYDEKGWAGYEIQKYLYEGKTQELEAFRLEVVQDAAVAFLELDRARRLVEIQLGNRELTRQSIEKARARIAAGWSSEKDVLRFEAQLASNDAAVRSAQALRLKSRFELNRLRNEPPEDPIAARPASIEEYGFAYGRPAIAKAVVAPESDLRMRDFLARLGLKRSPVLAAVDAAIEAAERQLTSSRRAFWVPSLILNAGVDHLTNSGSGDDFNETEYGVNAELTFPLFSGGAKFAGADQAREALAALRIERRAAARSLEASIRDAMAQSSASFESVGFAERGLAVARRNYELVDASYTLGVDSILDLLDAQSQLLQTELIQVNALYGFLESIISVERLLSLYPFLEPPDVLDSLLDQLERQLGIQP